MRNRISLALENTVLVGTVRPARMQEHARTSLSRRKMLYIGNRNQNIEERASGQGKISIETTKYILLFHCLNNGRGKEGY